MPTHRTTSKAAAASSIAGIMLAVCLVAALPLLASCTSSSSSSDASAVQGAIENALAPLQNLDANGVQSTIDNALGNADFSELEALGAGASNIIASAFDGFDFSVSDVKVTSDTATATLTISCKNPSDIESSVVNATRAAASDVTIDSLSPDKLQSLVDDILAQAIADTPVTKYDPITITLHKKNGTWEIDDASRQAITNIILGS